jgi:hypothetical protein
MRNGGTVPLVLKLGMRRYECLFSGPVPFIHGKKGSRYVTTEQNVTLAPELIQTFCRLVPLAAAGNTYIREILHSVQLDFQSAKNT